jgi:hypothetical protein
MVGNDAINLIDALGLIGFVGIPQPTYLALGNTDGSLGSQVEITTQVTLRDCCGGEEETTRIYRMVIVVELVRRKALATQCLS